MGERREPRVVYWERGLGKDMVRRYVCETKAVLWAMRITDALNAGETDGGRFVHAWAPEWEMLKAREEAGGDG